MADLPTSNRWRCLICRQRRWRVGTPAEWFFHYYTHHYKE